VPLIFTARELEVKEKRPDTTPASFENNTKFSLIATAINVFRIYHLPSPASHQFWGQSLKKNRRPAELTLFSDDVLLISTGKQATYQEKMGRTGLPTIILGI